jgi:catechol 2,3-dioxygenase-like lactoylglutathione lyase family enzyme
VITGVHVIVYTPDPEGMRAFFGDMLGLSSVDAGDGWPIFALPPAELAAHSADAPGRHQLYLMCDDITATVDDLRDKGVQFSTEIRDAGWGLITTLRLPDGSDLALYEPRHPSPLSSG